MTSIVAGDQDTQISPLGPNSVRWALFISLTALMDFAAKDVIRILLQT